MHCGSITFGNGIEGNVLGMGTLNFEGLPKIKRVLLVEGLKANLLSISQICDQGYTVNFDKENCFVLNKNGENVLEGFRSNDNCYTIFPSIMCQSVVGNNTDVWHAKLGHINFKTLKKLSHAGSVRGLPKLGKESDGKCKSCQLGKQLKITHKSVSDINTSKVLELLHMDLMGPIQIESLNGKRYIFVCVDDFSRYTWVDFLKEKYDTFDAFKTLCLKLKVEKEYLPQLKSIIKANLNDNQLSALLSLIYNIGAGNLKKSALPGIINKNPNSETIRNIWLTQNIRLGSQFEKGLRLRRKREVGLYFS